MARTPAKHSQYSLEGIAIFANLPADRRERIQQRCSWRRYEPGDPIVDYLDASDDVYFITEGETRVTIYSRVGKVVGRVVRHLPGGFAIEFIQPLELPMLERMLIRPAP